MTRRKAAWIAGVVAVLLAATYLLTRRGNRTAEPAAFVPARPGPPAQAAEVPASPPPSPPAAVPAVPVAPAAELAPRVEQPLATWLRVSIIAAALLAFFAVSLIATKQV